MFIVSVDSDAMISIKQEWWKSRDPVAALAKSPCDKSSASSLLQGLVKHGPWKDYVNALQFVSIVIVCILILQVLIRSLVVNV